MSATPDGPPGTGRARADGASGLPRSARPASAWRLAVSLCVGAVASALTFLYQQLTFATAPLHDFFWAYRAGWALLHGMNPYTFIRAAANVYPYESEYVYPVFAAVLSAPFAALPPLQAAAVFTFVGVTLAAWSFSARGFRHLLVFLTPAALHLVLVVPWSSYLVAAAVLPPLAWLASVKPNIGIAALAYNLRSDTVRWLVVGGGILLTLSFVLLPTWPADWLASMARNRGQSQYRIGLLQPFGFLLPLALLRWRRPEARLLLALGCIPQNFFAYEQLLLFLVPETILEIGVLVALSWLCGSASIPISVGPASAEFLIEASELAARQGIVLVYLPCLVMVLRRPNVGDDIEWPRVLSRLLAHRVRFGATQR